jgi:hypothetical protein
VPRGPKFIPVFFAVQTRTALPWFEPRRTQRLP